MKRKFLRLAVAGIVMAMAKMATAQTIETCTVDAGVINGDLGTATVSVPFDPGVYVAGRTTSSPITAAISSGITSYHTEWLDAIQKSVEMWSKVLSTSHPIVVHFYCTDRDGLPAISSDFLATGKPVNDAAGFTAAAGHGAAFFTNTYYVGGLACFMSGGVTSSGALSDIVVVINASPTPVHGGYNTNTDESVPCPSDKYDLLTVCAQAIGHGVGLLSETNGSAGHVAFAHTNQWPNIFEHFVNDNGTGSNTGVVTNLKDLGPTPVFLGSFVSGTGSYRPSGDSHFSNNAYFKGPTTPLTQLYIPPFYESGNNLNYLVPSASNLMSANLPTGRKIHVPSPTEIKMLNDIGWSANTATVGGTLYLQGEAAPYGSSFEFYEPSTALDLGGTYGYNLTLEGDYYSFVPGTMTLQLYTEDAGYITIVSLTHCEFGIPLTLPSDLSSFGTHRWARDINGRIRGILTGSGYDDNPSPEGFGASIDIGVNAPPDMPALKVENLEDANGCCADKILKFYAPGSQYFQVFSTEYVAGAWDTWSVSSPTTGDQSFTFTGLDETISRKFYVMAFNASGSSTSGTFSTNPCVFNVSVLPNPVVGTGTITLTADQSFLFTSVSITNTETGNVVALVPFDGTSPTVKLDLSQYQLSSGVYAFRATAPNPYPDNCNNLNSIAATGLFQLVAE